jgi:hypothetical protein
VIDVTILENVYFGPQQVVPVDYGRTHTHTHTHTHTYIYTHTYRVS